MIKVEQISIIRRIHELKPCLDVIPKSKEDRAKNERDINEYRYLLNKLTDLTKKAGR